MFGALFLKECRQVLKSLVYYIYVAVFVLFITSQLSSEGWEQLKEPVPGQSYYGETITKDQNLIMEGTLANLVQEVYHNSFATYPMGFYKGVTLTEDEAAAASEILELCTGKSFQTLAEEMTAQLGLYDPNPSADALAAAANYRVPVKDGFTYTAFETAMEDICRLVGRGSSYEKERYENSVYVPMTYEQARAEFDTLCREDRLTRACMRLFCDYAGIMLAVLPIFIGVSRVIRDKREKAQQVIFSRPVSSGLIIASRYLASLFLICIPVVITAFWQQRTCYDLARTLGIRSDSRAFLTVTGVWLLPEIMIVLALSFLITELTDTILAVFIQVAWGIASLFTASTLVGDFGFKLVARWNTFGQAARFASQEKEFLLNRGCYFLLAIVCVILTIIVYDKKRSKGGKAL